MRIRKQWHHLMSCPPPPDPTPCQELHHYHYETPFLEQPKHHSHPHPQPQPKQEKHVTHSDLQPTQQKEWVCSNSDTSDGEKEEKKESSGDFKMKRGKLIMHHYTTKDPELNPDQGKSVATDDDNRSCAAMTNPRNTNEKRGCGSGTSISSSQVSSLSTLQGGVDRWCKEEMTFPLKKRRESFKLIELDEKKSSSTTTGVRRKVVKKKPIVVEEDESKISTDTTVMRKARRGSNINGAMLMEGSKCSRVNGRGWRCYQQTLVGYALCEHHLGKARFRSISNNAPKKKKMINTVNDPQPLSSSTTTLSSSEEMKELEEDKVMVRTILKKRKIGMVKARSLSSLLGLSTHHQHQHTPNSIAT